MPVGNRGRALIREIEHAHADTPTLWWLGHSGFVIKYRHAIVYVDPHLSPRDDRIIDPPIDPAEVSHAGLVLCTHMHPGHFVPATVNAILRSSERAKLVVPKSAAEQAYASGVPYSRMVTTNSDLRVEYRDDRIYAVPSAHEQLDWTPLGGYPYLGYLIRFGNYTIYHAGDCVPYEGLAGRLRPYTVDIALLPVTGRPGNFEPAEAGQLAADIGAKWVVPMHYGVFANSHPDAGHFVDHMLGHRPEQRFKVFEAGERWELPE